MNPPSRAFLTPEADFQGASSGFQKEFRGVDHGPGRPLRLGSYPTPVQHLPTLSTRGCELWVKRDDQTHPDCGGSKVRKLERLLALRPGSRRLVTVGAAGSHHVLATAYFGRRLGLDVEGVLFPQPWTEHALEVLRAAIGAGLRAWPVRSVASVPLAVARRMARGCRFIPPGGSSVAGSMGYVDAARELAAQVRSGLMPEPDTCVVALGSGGTAAGLAAGFAAEGMKTQVVGVCVVRPVWLVRLVASRLAHACARRLGVRLTAVQSAEGRPTRSRLAVDDRFLGAGYGHESPEGRAALRVAEAKAAIVLDPTYTAKAFACALSLVGASAGGAGEGRCILYWHTLSSSPMSRLLEGAPAEDALDPALRRLLFHPQARSRGAA
ncbi:MAG TPA: pyridoxal-phosphate dependent enzyme [Polyangiaceae bacterium]|nr:pyridoxal-phosphate dependent enzyme [Polyangiaceae bacterium]